MTKELDQELQKANNAYEAALQHYTNNIARLENKLASLPPDATGIPGGAIDDAGLASLRKTTQRLISEAEKARNAAQKRLEQFQKGSGRKTISDRAQLKSLADRVLDEAEKLTVASTTLHDTCNMVADPLTFTPDSYKSLRKKAEKLNTLSGWKKLGIAALAVVAVGAAVGITMLTGGAGAALLTGCYLAAKSATVASTATALQFTLGGQLSTLATGLYQSAMGIANAAGTSLLKTGASLIGKCNALPMLEKIGVAVGAAAGGALTWMGGKRIFRKIKYPFTKNHQRKIAKHERRIQELADNRTEEIKAQRNADRGAGTR